MRMRKRNVGATLVEVMIALSILMFMISSIAGTLYYTTKISKQEAIFTEAANVAEVQLESIRQTIKVPQDFLNLTSDSTYKIADITGTEIKYVSNTEVTTVSNNMKFVNVTIYHRKMNSTQIEPDLTKPNSGKIIKLGMLLKRP
jgi:type II secretory pathway pseudopilin PulG